MAKKKGSEFRAYPWINKRLGLKGWNTRNPNRNINGQVYAQQECLEHPKIKAGLGLQKPENVVAIEPDLFWIIEAKPDQAKLPTALAEARAYAERINDANGEVLAPVVTGVAGNEEDGFEVENNVLIDGEWETVTLKGHPLSRVMSATEIKYLLSKNTADLKRPELSVAEVVAVSSTINKRLHIAKVSKEERARLVALLLLALGEDPTLRHRGAAKTFLDDINSRAETVFQNAGKMQLWKLVKIDSAASNNAEIARELNFIIGLLRETDIVHAAKHDDILGIFFESFLRYGNTSKELGIVLTPRHICWLACEALGIDQNSVVYDPAVGSGGFLIAALNKVRNSSGEAAAKKFAKTNLFAAEDEGRIAALAFINMHFRGDGKHNIHLGSCFAASLQTPTKKAKHPRFTAPPSSDETVERSYRRANRVLMNPPFALKDDDQSEVDFIDHGLEQLIEGGLLFVIIPASILYERKNKAWRERLLKKHTVKSVIAFPHDLFYPVSTETVGLILKAHMPHDKKEVLWARVIDDGFTKRKGYRVERENADYSTILKPIADALRTWVVHDSKLAASAGEFEFRQISNHELIPHSHLGTQMLDGGKYEEAALELYRGLATQQWDMQRVED